MCQEANGTVIGYDLCFQEHAPDVPGPLRQLAPPGQQVKGQNEPDEERIGFTISTYGELFTSQQLL